MSEKVTVKSGPAEFSKLRSFFWPIHREELKKFLPMGLMMFFILFNYAIVRNMKDALIIASPGGGAGVLPFLKGYVTLPASILFVILYAKLANIFTREKLFYVLVTPFLVFFGLFALFLYPNADLIHPSMETIEHLKIAIPNLQFLFPVYGLWSFSVFYVLAELWGSIMISLLFWQFANEITKTNEAKRFYALFGMIANVSLMIVFFALELDGYIRSLMPNLEDQFGFTIYFMMTLFVLNGLAIMGLYRFINKKVLTDPKFFVATEVSKKKDKPKLSVGESFKYLMKSKYLGFIAILVIAYGISIGLVELAWKEQLKLYYPDRNDYLSFMGKFNFATGFCTIVFILLLKNVVRKFGWFTGAVITPAMILVTSVLFFGFIIFREELNPICGMLGASALAMSVIIGMCQNVFSKGVKYSLFDTTKEMAYIPLDQELKVKGKAAVDVIGGRLGKGAAGYIASILLVITAGGVQSITTYLAFIVVAITVAWIYSVGSLNKLYHKALEEHEADEAAAQKVAANDDKKSDKKAAAQKAA